MGNLPDVPPKGIFTHIKIKSKDWNKSGGFVKNSSDIKKCNDIENFLIEKILIHKKENRQKRNNMIPLKRLAQLLNKHRSVIRKRAKGAGINGVIFKELEGEKLMASRFQSEIMYTKKEAEKIISLYFHN